MGKWTEVHCSCPNRRPLLNSGRDSEPYRNKRRLTARQSEERQVWEQTIKDMYECGHRDGCLIELWPGNIVQLGRLIELAFRETEYSFPIFARVGDWRCYQDELLLLSPGDATLWLAEVEGLWRILEGRGISGDPAVERLFAALHEEDSQGRAGLEAQLGQIRSESSFARVNPLMENVLKGQAPDLQSAAEKLSEVLGDARRLCQASIESGNPVRLLW